MSWKPKMLVLLAALLAWSAQPARALETDQFTPPPHPLADLGRELDLKMSVVLRMVANDANDRLAAGGKQAQECLTNDYFVQEINDMLSSGLPECAIERWIRYEPFPENPAKFEVSVLDSVYGHTLLGRPITMIDLAPTVNLYGHYVGTDKVGHFFQQGHDYYETFRKEQGRGKSEADAVRAAVQRGVDQEWGIYGMFTIDVYSNADLASNMAGFMFYRNLTAPVKIGEHILPPLLVLRDGRWELNALAGEDFMRNYVTDHWDESCNPCYYAMMLRGIVRSNLRDYGSQWVTFRHTSRQREVARLQEMKTWNGMDYGHSGFKDVMTIVNAWFDKQPALANALPAHISP